jgi:dolichyl-phosphate-mannose--protein O-mannosyl transferase
MANPKTRLLLILTALSALLHGFRLSEPRRVVFDEVHFGGFVSSYLGDRRYFFDIHPPHAKLLIAGVAALGGYHGDQSFKGLGDPINKVSPALMRFTPAVAGTLLPAALFGFLLGLGATPMAAFLAGLAILLDNSVLLQTRIIALDGFLLTATFGALAVFLAAERSETRPRRTVLALLAGALAGLAAGTKFTGLAALGLIGMGIVLQALQPPSWDRVRLAASYAVWVLSGALLVYAAGWAVHFSLLSEPGPGYRFGAPHGELLADTVKLHLRMLASNYGLAASHPWSSPWWSWPLMQRSIFYWGEGDSQLYFLGNPVVWWGSTLGLIVVVANLLLVRVTDLEVRGVAQSPPRQLWLPLAGYTVALLPLTRVPRALFLYHYLTPLLFAVCAVVLWLDHVGWTRPGGWRSQRRSFYGALVCLVVGFLLISPFTFSFVEAPAYRELLFRAFPSWR